METDAREKLYRLLRSYRPHALVAVDVEGNKTPVSLKSGKGRWDGAITTLVSMSEELERVEFLDADGAVSRVWRMPEPAFRPPPDVDAPAPSAPPLGEVPMLPWPLVERLLRLQAEAAESAVRQHMAATSQGHEKLVQTLQLVTEANTHLMDMQQATLQTAYEATLARGEAAAALASAAKGESESNPMEGMLMALVASKMGLSPTALAAMAGNGAGDPEKH